MFDISFLFRNITRNMVLIIDASNITAGGGQVHLIELLNAANIDKYGFSEIVVCAPSYTLSRITGKMRLSKHHHRFLDGNYFQRWRWRRFVLPKLLVGTGGLLFVPGAVQPPIDWPYVTMCQNLLPLELRELLRYKMSFTTLRLLILRFLHLRGYKKAAGTIFLTEYSWQALPTLVKKQIKSWRIVPHGVDTKKFSPFPFRPYFAKDGNYFEILYVSILDVYKHQDKVALAVINLNKRGNKVKVTFIGPAYSRTKRKLDAIIKSSLQYGKIISHIGSMPHHELGTVYQRHHASVFASTCEAFGMIVTEAMAMGMPLLCSNRSSMKETVGDAALYFDPLDIKSIENGILSLMNDDSLRKCLAMKAISRSQLFSWERCAHQTFDFLSYTARKTDI